jgi:hypothetical protein
MAPEAAALLWDAHAAAQAVCGFGQSRNFNDYLTDPMLSAAVARKLRIVGETLNQLRRVDAGIHPISQAWTLRALEGSACQGPCAAHGVSV